MGDPPTRSAPSAAELLHIAERLAGEAASTLVAGLQRDDLGVVTKTSATDLVTELDRIVERRLVEGILTARPGDSVLGEEGASHAGTTAVRWVVDPIDGTTNFVYGLPGFSVSVAAQIDGSTVAGCVVDPLHGDTFTALAGGGARRNGRPIHGPRGTDLATSLVGTGFSYLPERRRAQATVLAQVLPAVRDIRRLGSAAVDLCWTACGRLDAFYEKGLQPWDFAAGALVAAEAGARVGDLDGGPASTAFTLAAAPALFEPLRELLRAAGAADA